MPFVSTDRPRKRIPLWEKTLRQQIRGGQAIPVISGEVIRDHFLGGQADMIRDYADHVKNALRGDDPVGQFSSGQIGNAMPSFDAGPEAEVEAEDMHRTEEILPLQGANYIKYLMTDPTRIDPAQFPLGGDDLLQMTKFKRITDTQIKSDASLRTDYLDFIKNRFYCLARNNKVPEHLLNAVEAKFDDLKFSEFPERLGFPSLKNATEHPLMILARFPFRIYVTTSHHNFIERALREAEKHPRMEFCRWHEGLRQRDDIPQIFETKSVLDRDKKYIPTDKEPLVYHLLGHDDYPESLVLTDDDYMRFLIAVSRNPGPNFDPALTRIRGDMSNFALILLGYELHSWDFKVLFWGMIHSEAQKPEDQKQAGISIQVRRSQLEQSYYKRYLQKMASCEVFWGDIKEYTQHLQTYLP